MTALDKFKLTKVVNIVLLLCAVSIHKVKSTSEYSFLSNSLIIDISSFFSIIWNIFEDTLSIISLSLRNSTLSKASSFIFV